MHKPLWRPAISRRASWSVIDSDTSCIVSAWMTIAMSMSSVRRWRTSVGLADAARHGHLAAIERTVLDRPQLINATDEFYKTPLMTASAAGQTNVVNLLLDKGYTHFSAVSILHTTTRLLLLLLPASAGVRAGMSPLPGGR